MAPTRALLLPTGSGCRRDRRAPRAVAAALCALALLAACGDVRKTVPPVRTADVPAPIVVVRATTTQPPGATPAPAAGPSAPGFSLVGTTLADGASFAILQRTGDARFVQVRVGDRIDRLVVTGIAADRIDLAGPGDASVRRTLLMAERRPQHVAVARSTPTQAQIPPEHTEPDPQTVVVGH